MPRCYTVNLSPAAATVAIDLVAIIAADDIPVKIRAIRVWQTSDVGDAQDEVLTINVVRGNTTNGSGGAAGTQVPKDGHDAAASFTSRVGDTTAASAGTPVTVYSTGWNVRAPFEYTFPDQIQPRTDQGQGQLVVRLGGAPADSLTIGASVDIEEG
jgi:hypothetical protein